MAHKSPSEILRKFKKPHDTDEDDTKKDSGDDASKDKKLTSKDGKHNSLLDFIAKHKKATK